MRKQGSRRVALPIHTLHPHAHNYAVTEMRIHAPSPPPATLLSVSVQVVGQPEALRVVADAVRVARAGLQPGERPQGVFLLVGPTGVGKTQLCKALAGQLFDSEEAAE